jgi:hypothetical protein
MATDGVAAGLIHKRQAAATVVDQIAIPPLPTDVHTSICMNHFRFDNEVENFNPKLIRICKKQITIRSMAFAVKLASAEKSPNKYASMNKFKGMR